MEDKKTEYNKRLAEFKEKCQEYKKLVELYEKHKITAQELEDKTKALKNEYSSLVAFRNEIDDNSLEKPRLPELSLGSAKELEIKNLKKELQEYEMVYDAYEEDYELLGKKQKQVEDGEISYEEYEKYAEYMIERYKYLKDLADDLNKRVNATLEEYKLKYPTKEELEAYLKEKAEYEKELEEYNESLEAYRKIEITSDTYVEETQKIIAKYERLSEKRKSLIDHRKKIYKSENLTILKKLRDSLKNKQENGMLDEKGKAQLEKVEKEILEYNRLSRKLTVKKVQKVEEVNIPKKPRKKGSSQQKNNIDLDGIQNVDEPQQPGFIGENKPKKKEPVPKVEKTKVKKLTAWEWIKKNKKKILIGIGIAALAVALVVILTQLLPAITASIQAANVANMAGAMVNNANLWSTIGTVAEQQALHGANTGLASLISQITGQTALFAPSTGLWTIGGAPLQAFAAGAASNAAAAAGTVTSLTNLSLLTGLGGLGSIGIGALMNSYSERFYIYIREINEIEKNIDYNKIETNDIPELNAIRDKINNDEILTYKENKKLNKKIDKVIKKIQKKKDKLEIKEPTMEIDPVVSQYARGGATL